MPTGGRESHVEWASVVITQTQPEQTYPGSVRILKKLKSINPL
jgi:hypothetical protein